MINVAGCFIFQSSLVHARNIVMCFIRQIALEGLRVKVPPGTSSHMTKLITICMNEDPGKRPRFDMVIPIMEKMKASTS